MDDTITITGNLAAEPESRGDGATPITTFRVGSTQRRLDKESGRWVDAHVSWYNVSAFRQLAVHALSSLHKGQRVIVTGKLKIREYDTANGKNRSADIEADAIGHDLRWGTSEFRKNGTETDRAAPAATQWPVRTVGEESGDGWSVPMGSAPEQPAAAAPAPGAPPVPAADPVAVSAGMEPAYSGEDAPF